MGSSAIGSSYYLYKKIAMDILLEHRNKPADYFSFFSKSKTKNEISALQTLSHSSDLDKIGRNILLDSRNKHLGIAGLAQMPEREGFLTTNNLLIFCPYYHFR
jgi:hypothetical protein